MERAVRHYFYFLVVHEPLMILNLSELVELLVGKLRIGYRSHNDIHALLQIFVEREQRDASVYSG